MRFFRSTDAVYEQVRTTLDAAWGHPNAETRTTTCIEPSGTAPHDSRGKVLLAVQAEFCDYHAVAEILPQLLASGAVEEIDEAAFREALQESPV
jgi:hypothetical protein